MSRKKQKSERREFWEKVVIALAPVLLTFLLQHFIRGREWLDLIRIMPIRCRQCQSGVTLPQPRLPALMQISTLGHGVVSWISL
jgi:hypothetical protein